MKVSNVKVVSAKVTAEVELGPDELHKLGIIVDEATLHQLALAQAQEQDATLQAIKQEGTPPTPTPISFVEGFDKIIDHDAPPADDNTL